MKIDKNSIWEDLLEDIELPEDLDRLVTESVEKGYQCMKRKKEAKRLSMVKRAAMVLGIAAAGGAVAIPVKAFVVSMVQERMEQTPQEELTEVLENVDAQQAEADRFTREYTEEEKERVAALSKAYNQGTFPQEPLRQEESASPDITDELYFAVDTATFCLPERELTDEEILQIIDFASKRDYVLAQRAGQEQSMEQKEKETQMKNELAKTGGLTEEQAKELGREWLQKLYGASGEGMEISFYLDGEQSSGSEKTYYFGYNLRSIRSCSVTLNAKDGSLIRTHEFIVADETDSAPVSTAVLSEKQDALFGTAKKTLTDKLGKESDYDKIIMAYDEADGHLAYMNTIAFLFVKPDGSVYEVTMSAVRDRLSEYMEWNSLEDYKTEMGLRTAKANSVSKGSMVYKEIK